MESAMFKHHFSTVTQNTPAKLRLQPVLLGLFISFTAAVGSLTCSLKKDEWRTVCMFVFSKYV